MGKMVILASILKSFGENDLFGQGLGIIGEMAVLAILFYNFVNGLFGCGLGKLVENGLLDEGPGKFGGNGLWIKVLESLGKMAF